MEEKIIVKAEFKKNYFLLVLLGIVLVLWLIPLFMMSGWENDGVADVFRDYFRELFTNLFCPSDGHWVYFTVGFYLLPVCGFVAFMMNGCALTVMPSRVIGKTSFGKQVDLPMNQISAIGQGLFSSITVGTSSGRVYFWWIQNRKEVYEELSKLIYNLHEHKEKNSNADELKKFKELLDQGIITQEEFDAKKKELLGL